MQDSPTSRKKRDERDDPPLPSFPEEEEQGERVENKEETLDEAENAKRNIMQEALDAINSEADEHDNGMTTKVRNLARPNMI